MPSNPYLPPGWHDNVPHDRDGKPLVAARWVEAGPAGSAGVAVHDADGNPVCVVRLKEDGTMEFSFRYGLTVSYPDSAARVGVQVEVHPTAVSPG